MARRTDLLVEVDTTLDGTGRYVGDWVDTAGVLTIRVFTTQGSSLLIEQSADQVQILADTLGVDLEFDLTMRYFRIAVDGGTPNAAFRGTVRAIG